MVYCPLWFLSRGVFEFHAHFLVSVYGHCTDNYINRVILAVYEQTVVYRHLLFLFLCFKNKKNIGFKGLLDIKMSVRCVCSFSLTRCIGVVRN